MSYIGIGSRRIGPYKPVHIAAEVSANHTQDSVESLDHGV